MILDSNERYESLDVPFWYFQTDSTNRKLSNLPNYPRGSVLQNEAYMCSIFGTKRHRDLILVSNERSQRVDLPFDTFGPIR